jgi:hypothetical protein
MNLQSLTEHVTSLNGFDSNSASLSDTCIVTIDNNKKIFLKSSLFPSEKLIRLIQELELRGFLKMDIKKFVSKLNALQYEAAVYKLTNDMLYTGISPCFLFTYGYERKQSFDLFASLLKNGTELSLHDAKLVLFRNTNSFFSRKKRLSMTTITPGLDKYDYKNIEDIYQYNILYTQPAGGVTIGSILKREFILSDEDLFTILFQVAISCYAMYKMGINHNDLHANNVFVEQLAEPSIFGYKVDGTRYYIHASYIPTIYDFDRAYCPYIGDNPLFQNDPEYCEKYSQCNNLVENRDFLKLICGLYLHYFDNEWKDVFLDILAKDEYGKQLLYNSFNKYKNCYLQTEYVENIIQSIDLEDYKHFNDMPRIIDILYSLISPLDFYEASGELSGKENLYIVEDGCFTTSFGKRIINSAYVQNERTKWYDETQYFLNEFMNM